MKWNISLKALLAGLAIAAALAVAWQYRIDIAGARLAAPQLWFSNIAREVLHGGGFPANLYYPPGMIWLFITIFGIFGDSASVETWSQVALATAECGVGAILAWRLFGALAGAIAAWLLALWPYGTPLAVAGGGEITPVLLLVLLALHALRSAERAGAALSALALYGAAGVLAGLPGLVRADAFLIPIAVVMGLLVRRPWQHRTAMLGMAAFLAAAYLAYVPWTVYNYQRTGRITPTAPQARALGVSLFIGIGEISGRGGATFFDDDFAYYLGRGSPVAITDYEKINDALTRRVIQIVERDPLLFIRACVYRLVSFTGVGWRNYFLSRENQPALVPPGGPVATVLRATQRLLSLPVFWALVGVSLVVLRRRLGGTAPLHAVVLYYALVHLPIHFEARYILVVYPLLLIVVSGGLATLAHLARRTRRASA